MELFLLLAFTHLVFFLFLTVFAGCLPRSNSVAGCPVTWLSPRFKGFQTFGEDYDVNQAKMDLTIKLKRPQGQFSVYEDHASEKKDEKPH